MAAYYFNKYGERNIFNPTPLVTAPPACAWPPAEHQEASVKQTTPIQLCEMLQSLYNEYGKLSSDLAIGDTLMIDYLPSSSQLHSVGVNIKTVIAGFTFTVERATAGPLNFIGSTTILTDPTTRVCTGTEAFGVEAALPVFGAAAGRSTYWASGVKSMVALPDILVLKVAAIPAGGLLVASGNCCADKAAPRVSFTLNIDNGQHLG